MIKLKNELTGLKFSFLVLTTIITLPFLYFAANSIETRNLFILGLFLLFWGFISSVLMLLLLSTSVLNNTVLVEVGIKELSNDDLQCCHITKNNVYLKYKTASKDIEVEEVKYIFESPEAETVYRKMKDSASTSDVLEKVEIVKYLRVRKFLINLFHVELEEQYKAILTYKIEITDLDNCIKHLEYEKWTKQ